MKNSTLLIVIGKDASLIDLAKKLEAIRAVPAHATIVIAAEIPPFPYYTLGVAGYGTAGMPRGGKKQFSKIGRLLRRKQTRFKPSFSNMMCLVTSPSSQAIRL